MMVQNISRPLLNKSNRTTVKGDTQQTTHFTLRGDSHVLGRVCVHENQTLGETLYFHLKKGQVKDSEGQ